MKIDRMLTIIVMLLNRNRISAKALAEKFEVSVRTVYRDIESINLAGIPVVSYPGNSGGFCIMKNYKLDNQLLTINNVCSMLTALQAVNRNMEDTEIESSIEKLRTLIPEEKAGYVNLQMEQMIITMLPWTHSKKQKQSVKQLQSAVAESRIIQITYRNYDNQSSTREIEPMSLVLKGDSWYLFAYCLLKSDYRIFKVSRIRDIQQTDRHFQRRPKSYREVIESGEKDTVYISVTLQFTAGVRTRVEDIFDSDQIEVLNNGMLVVTAQFPESDWYVSLILSFGDDVDVLGPQSVRQTIAHKIQSMNNKYF